MVHAPRYDFYLTAEMALSNNDIASAREIIGLDEAINVSRPMFNI